MRRAALFVLFAALFLPHASAQRGMPARHFAAHTGFRHSAYPLAFFSDPFFSEDLPAAQPAVIVMQTPTAAQPEPERFPPPAEPLLIELQGDRYVLLSGEISPATQLTDRESAPNLGLHEAGSSGHIAERQPAILVFRDGHREEISDYTIAQGILYDQGSYSTHGIWNRKIELSSLNLSETVNSNLARGIRFQVPHAPNEVIVGP